MEDTNLLANINRHAITKNDSKQYDMIVFCHLRWQFVYQRPQHLISRMSLEYSVLLVEEPILFDADQEFTANLFTIKENLDILQPRVRNITDIARILPHYVSNKQVKFGWFYSASFSSLIETVEFNAIIYDCMDELSLFKNAPQSLIDQENYLLKHANVVFTGGKSLYESKKALHKNVYCFPSSVDQQHFARALNGLQTPDDIANLPRPIVGYFGVIDERIDLELLEYTAKSLPEVSFLMIGPLAKIEDADLPRLSNIYYTGMKSYDELPAYLKTFNIAMMPFALNDATRYISPTKTLEYMAAFKPIISTRIKDVERDYSHCVTIVDNGNDFCRAILHHKLIPFKNSDAYEEILDQTSWDTTATKMKTIINQLSI